MIFNCLGCGISISSYKNSCPYCKENNAEAMALFTGKVPKPEKKVLKERLRGTILAYVHRY